MFKRDIIIISLIIVMIFTISSVCAVDSEIQDNGTHNSTDNVVSAVNDNNLKMYDANEILDGNNDFDELDETINGNTSETYIELKKDYHGSYDGGNGIPINRDNIVIDGKGHTINSTGENSRIFNVHADGITLKNIIFSGGRSDYGGAISTDKNLNIINCTFSDNQATSSSTDYGGGAIYGNNVKMNIYDCTFIGNHASSNGGAICAAGTSSDDFEIFNCTFIDNVADMSGGAFFSLADTHMGNIINSTFINNRAKAGDAIYMWADNGVIDRCAFINNTANSMIYGSYTTLVLNNSVIVNNYGDNLLEVMDDSIIDNNWWGTTADDSESPVISGTTLTNYYILNMTVDDDSVDITLNNLYDNGVITTSYSKYALPPINFTVRAKNIEVPDNVVLPSSGEATIEHSPAGLYEITIGYNGIELTRDVKPTFKWLSNQINGEGSEFSLDQDCTYDSAKDSSLTNGIEFAKDITIDGQGHTIDAKESSNIFFFDDDTNSYSLTLKNIIFANAVGNNGAAVYFKGNKIEIINCTFINNKAVSQGDAVYVANALSNANRITGSVFTENTGSNSILCLNLDSNAKLVVDNSVFINNSAAKNINGTGNITAKYNWWGNTVENNGDISKTEGVNVTNWLFLKIDAVPDIVGSATLSLNNVYDNEGKISTYSGYALRPITFKLAGLNATSSVFAITLGKNGQADYQFRMDRISAALTASYDNVTTSAQLEYVIVDDGSFKALNEIIFFSDDGGVIELTHDYAYCDSDTITDGIVIPRKITINGNGHTIDAKGKTRIFMVPEGVSHITINNISFINAKASYGSVMVISKGSNYLNLSKCNFTDNVATNYGAVIDCVGDYCNIDNCNFINNHAVSKAGVIRYYHDNQAYIKNSNFINNSVADGSSGGGVIYVDDGKVVIDKSVFTNNTANDRSGSVLYTSKSATITNSIFLNNPGTYVIYGSSGVTLTNNWFGNTSDDYNLIVDNTVSGVYNETTLNNWLYLDIKFLEDYAVISLNNAYNKSGNSTAIVSDYNLPEITLNISPANLSINASKVTLDGTGKAIVQYSKISDDAKLTVSYKDISLTKNVSDFDVLQTLVNEKDEIELGRDYTYGNGDSITDGIAISRSITIDGKGHTIDANNQARIFKIMAGNVTLKNINFINGYADFAAAICCEDSNLTVIECNFSNNNAYDNNSCGGAVYFDGDELTIDNSKFISNNAKNGGAVIIEKTTAARIMNTEFSENGAKDYGALGIFAGNILIDQCTFDNNHANDSVGALFLAGNVTLSNTIFKRNDAKEYGALFYIGDKSNSLVIYYCQFIDNDCCAVYLYSYHAKILNSNFMNSTSERGFAIYNGALNELYLSNNTISTDKAEIFSVYGGNISSQITVTILDNKTVYKHLNESISVYLTFCDGDGNLVQVQDFDLLVNSTKISYVYNNITQQYEANFTANEVGSYPVTISDIYLSNLTLKNAEINIVDISDDFSTLQDLINKCNNDTLTLTGNYTFNPLTDVDFVDGIVINKNIIIDGAGFTIDAKNQARIFYVKSDSATIKNITLINAKSAGYGGAICFEGTSLTVLNSKFINNTADSGRAIFNAMNATLTLSNSTFESDCLNGRTIENSGILYLYNNTLNNKSCEIFNHGGKILSSCTAIVNAGTTFVFGDVGLMKVDVYCPDINISDNQGVNITVLKKEVTFEAINVANITYGDVLKITAKVSVDEGIVSVVVNGKQYSAEVNGKTAIIEIPKLNAGQYDVDVTYNGGDKYTNPSQQVAFTVSKRNAQITAKGASYIINYGGKYSLTVKGVANEKLTFTLNGKNIGSAVTDGKGVASIKLTAKILKAVKAGKKNLVIKLKNSNYNVAAKTVKITINKEKTKIAAKNEAFKSNVKTKNYSITLKNSKGKGIKKVQVTIKVGKKTFNAKTKSNGKATFKITKLTKKGKYPATIKFKGNAYYKPSTKKVKITVK